MNKNQSSPLPKFLKPGGKLAAICLEGSKRREAFQHSASKWIDLPAGTFKDAGTNVSACAFLIEP